jgi:hypothetical protein
MAKSNVPLPGHSSAWVVQTWISFTLAATATALGILYLPVNSWVKGYLGMGFIFSIGSTISLSKTIRDIDESKRILTRVDEAKLERLLAEHNPFKE